MDSTPKINSTVQGPDLDITLRYNVRVDGSRSRVVLVVQDGTLTQPTLAKQAKPDILQMHASGLKAGAYKLRERAGVGRSHEQGRSSVHGEVGLMLCRQIVANPEFRPRDDQKNKKDAQCERRRLPVCLFCSCS